MLQRALGRAAHRHLVEQYGELAFEVDTVGLAGQRDVGARTEEVVTSALVDQRDAFDAFDGLKVEGLLHQFAVAEEARTV